MGTIEKMNIMETTNNMTNTEKTNPANKTFASPSTCNISLDNVQESFVSDKTKMKSKNDCSPDEVTSSLFDASRNAQELERVCLKKRKYVDHLDKPFVGSAEKFYKKKSNMALISNASSGILQTLLGNVEALCKEKSKLTPVEDNPLTEDLVSTVQTKND